MLDALKSYAEWLWKRSESVRTTLIANILIGWTSVLLNLAFIGVSKFLVDIATGKAEGEIAAYATVLLALLLARIAATAVNIRLENVTSSKLNFAIRHKHFTDLLQSQWMGRERIHSGDLLNRLFTDSNQVTNVICQDLPAVFTTVFQLIAAFLFLCKMDWELAVVILLITPVLFAFSRFFFKKVKSLTKDIKDSESKIQSHIQESIQHRTTIQSLEQGENMGFMLKDLQEGEFQQILKRTHLNVFSRMMVMLTFNLGYAAALIWGVVGISKGVMTFGMLTAFLQLVGQIQGPSARLLRQIPGIVYATASIDRLKELDETPKEKSGRPEKLEGRLGIRFDKVSFKYPDSEENVLSDFNFNFKPGSKIAVIGETGIGKSTMIKLILSLLRPQKGSISIYSESGRRVESSPLSRINLVYVPQGNSLFSGTIRQNLLMGKADASEDEMVEALRMAVADFVLDLPEGLDSVCGERGGGLSEGQAQRIAIARGLLRPGMIMLMDEFSSSLDNQTEEKLVRNLCANEDGKTMIFITHREKVIEYCDGILKIEK